jgi:outer membrane protein assembly factor BamB
VRSANPRFFVTGGTIPRDAPCYVTRQADDDLLDGLRTGTFCYVLTTRQMGKSSLMVRAATRLRADGAKCVLLDVTALGQSLTQDQWYDGLLSLVGRQLDMEDDLDQFWRAHRQLGALQRWTSALRDVVVARADGPIVIFVDEIDAVGSLPFSADEFFGAIRELHNRRAEDAALGRLTFCLIGVATPSDLIKDPRTTPFNIGRRIELHDFTEAECGPLLDGFRSPRDAASGATASRLMRRILHWTGGHPYLTQRLCHEVAQAQADNGERDLDSGDVDRLCDALFLAPGARSRDDNLTFARDRMLAGTPDVAALLDLYGRVRAGRRVVDDDASADIRRLKLAGTVRVVQGRLQVRNRIYASVFSPAWARSSMPDAELWRQRAAYRRGVLQASAAAALVGAAAIALAWLGWCQARAERDTGARKHRAARELSLALEAARRDLARAASKPVARVVSAPPTGYASTDMFICAHDIVPVLPVRRGRTAWIVTAHTTDRIPAAVTVEWVVKVNNRAMESGGRTVPWSPAPNEATACRVRVELVRAIEPDSRLAVKVYGTGERPGPDNAVELPIGAFAALIAPAHVAGTSGGLARPGFPKARADEANTGCCPYRYAGPASRATVVMVPGLTGECDAAPVVHGDVAYLANDNGYLYAVGLGASPRVLWRCRVSGSCLRSVPAVARDGTVYLGCDDGSVYRVDPRARAVIGAYQTGKEVETQIAIGRDGTVYAGNWHAKLFALKPDLSAARWVVLLGGAVAGSPALAPDGTVLVGCSGGAAPGLYALAPRTGSVLWYKAIGGVFAAPAVWTAGGTWHVIAASLEGRMHVFDRVGAGSCVFPPMSEPPMRKFESSPALRSAGPTTVAFIGNDDGSLYKLDAMTLALQARAAIGSPLAAVYASPILSAGPVTADDRGARVFAGTENGVLHALRQADLRECAGWPSPPLGNSLRLSPVLTPSNQLLAVWLNGPVVLFR